MKKMILLFTLTLVSANTVKGMDGTYAAEKNITQIIRQSKDLNCAIDLIVSHQSYTKDLTSFTLLVHVLADKFGRSTNSVALRFQETPIAKIYDDLGTQLMMTTMKLCKKIPKESIDTITELLQQGADFNYTSQIFGTPLEYAIRMQNTELVQLLLNHKAKLCPSMVGYAIGTLGWEGKVNPEILQMISDAFSKADSKTQKSISNAFSQASPETQEQFNNFISK